MFLPVLRVPCVYVCLCMCVVRARTIYILYKGPTAFLPWLARTRVNYSGSLLLLTTLYYTPYRTYIAAAYNESKIKEILYILLRVAVASFLDHRFSTVVAAFHKYLSFLRRSRKNTRICVLKNTCTRGTTQPHSRGQAHAHKQADRATHTQTHTHTHAYSQQTRNQAPLDATPEDSPSPSRALDGSGEQSISCGGKNAIQTFLHNYARWNRSTVSPPFDEHQRPRLYYVRALLRSHFLC